MSNIFSEKYFETWKHIATLTSALIVVVAGLATKITIPSTGVILVILIFFGCSVVIALSWSVHAMYEFANERASHFKSGIISLVAFSTSITLVFVASMLSLIKEVQIFTPREPAIELQQKLEELRLRLEEIEKKTNLPYCGDIPEALQKIQDYEQHIRKVRRPLSEYNQLLSSKEAELGCTLWRRGELIDPSTTFIGGETVIEKADE